jgi:hypothetical protein
MPGLVANPVRSPAEGVDIWESGFFYCSDGIGDYTFSIKTYRFLKSYMIGYVGGKDNNDDTPSVQAGTCTKID